MMMSNKLWDPPLCPVHEHIHIYFDAQSILHENNSAPSNYPLYLTQPVGINPHLHSPQDKDFNFPPSNDRDVFYCFSCCVKYHFMICRIPHVIFFILIPTLHDLSLYRKFSNCVLCFFNFPQKTYRETRNCQRHGLRCSSLSKYAAHCIEPSCVLAHVPKISLSFSIFHVILVVCLCIVFIFICHLCVVRDNKKKPHITSCYHIRGDDEML